MTRLTRSPYADFLQIWEEGYVTDSISYELMHTKGLVIMEGAPLLRPEGGLDREKIMTWLEAIVPALDSCRVRLQRGVLGLTPPAWVPDEQFDLARHVRFADDVVPLEMSRLWELAGHYDGILDIKHPLWRLRFSELDNGDVALGMNLHHVTADGLAALRFLALLTRRTPNEAVPEPQNPFADRRAPRAIGLPVLAARSWIRRQSSVAGAWRDYRSKSLYRRFRRVGGRMLRPFRDLASRDEEERAIHVPDRHTDYVVVDGRDVARRASRLGGSVTDLLLAAGIHAYGSPHPVSLRYAVSGKPGADRVRNSTVDLRLSGSADDELDELVASLRSQIESGESAASEDAEEIGYATMLPWVSSPRYFIGSQVKAVVPYSTGLGFDELAISAILHNGSLSIGVTMQANSDVTAVTQRVRTLMTDSPDTDVASPAARQRREEP